MAQPYNSVSASDYMPSTVYMPAYRYPLPTAEIDGTTSQEHSVQPTPAIKLALRVADDQAWYFTVAWQAAELEADQNLVDGEYEDFDSMEDLLESL